MRNYLVVYYSNTGNSKFKAQKLANDLACDSKEISPIFNNVGFLFLLSLLKINISTNIATTDISQYDEIIIIGPIWGGLIISPLRNVLNTCVKASKTIHFAITCESKEEDKNSKYGYAQVLKKSNDLGGRLVKNTAAFSTALVNSGNKPNIPKLTEKIKITEANYSEALKLRVADFVKKIKATMP